jgi:5-epi-alpha-selinene synthase
MDELHCPFVSLLNPATELAHRRTRAWAERFELLLDASVRRQVATEQFTWLVGRFFPWAPTRELELISDFTSWLFLHDDVCDETALGHDPRALADQFDWLMGILTRRRPPRPGQPFDAALADLRDRFEEAAPSWAWFTRFVTAVQQYFDGCVWEANNRAQGVAPPIDVFVCMRPFAGGMYIYLDFIELVLRAELPLVVRGHEDILRLRQATLNVACWHNDLFSLEKELARSDVHNLVVVLARETSADLAEARAVAVARCNAEVQLFEEVAGRLRPFGAAAQPLVVQYRDSLGALMRGNLDWSLSTRRYRREVRA